MNPFTPATPDHVRRASTTAAAFLVGLPLAAVILATLHFGPLQQTVLARYVSHTVECVEVVLFCCALGALGAKLRHNLTEQHACQTEVLPPWDGKPVPATEASNLQAYLNRLPWHLHNTFLAQRVAGVLDFLCQRRSADQLDDHLRALADTDAMALEASYSLTRFITWAIPILGFLGTVLGITGAIAGVTPEVLEHSLSSVTDGLALAFDATALALGLTMITMFCSFLVERQEQGVLDAVDRYVERQLAHRFQRVSPDTTPFIEILQQSTQSVIEATGNLVQRQADIWARALAETERQTAEQQSRLAVALETALDRTLQTYSQRLAALEQQTLERTTGLYEQLAGLATAVRDAGREQQAALAGVAEAVADQAALLGRLQEGEANLVRLQTTLQQNLTALAGAGAFDQAVHTLTAAVHLLTARSAALAETRTGEATLPLPAPPNPPRLSTGKAA